MLLFYVVIDQKCNEFLVRLLSLYKICRISPIRLALIIENAREVAKIHHPKPERAEGKTNGRRMDGLVFFQNTKNISLFFSDPHGKLDCGH